MLVRRIAITATSAALLAAGAAAVPSSASAASGCWYRSPHWYCNNVVGAGVYGSPMFADTVPRLVGRMYSNPSWFICRIDNGPYVGGPHAHRWVYTKADNGQWGWMKDTSIYSETNTLPAC